MTQSDEKSSSHQSLAQNLAAMYLLSGKQSTPASGQKTVKRDDVASGKVKVENIPYCTMCDSYGFEHQRAKQQEQTSPRTLQESRICDSTSLDAANTSRKTYEAIRLDSLTSHPSLFREAGRAGG